MHIRPTTSAELESIEATRQAYRTMWGKLNALPKPLNGAAFEGGREDIDALDFIDYELGGNHPEGIAGAAVIWGGVLVATGALTWAIGDETHFVLVGASEHDRVLIFPYARVAELSASAIPQFGKYEWLMEEAVLRLCVQCVGDEHKLRSLIRLDRDSGFIALARQWVGRADAADGKPRRSTRG